MILYVLAMTLSVSAMLLSLASAVMATRRRRRAAAQLMFFSRYGGAWNHSSVTWSSASTSPNTQCFTAPGGYTASRLGSPDASGLIPMVNYERGQHDDH